MAIKELIDKDESDKVEFKVAACWNAQKNIKDNEMKENIIQAVDAFMNADGGKVLIGVDNHGKVIGLAEDYRAANPQKQNRDGYELFLNNILGTNLGGSNTQFYKISFHRVEGKDVCCIEVQHAAGPVFVRNETFYIRNGNSKLKLNIKDATGYIKQRWG